MGARMKMNEKGQALIELIIFLPMMFMLYSMISGFANAIYGSINQQKVTRGYFYYRVQNNSTIPKPDEEKTYQAWQQFGMFFIGWKEYFVGNSPVQPCYKISVPMKPADADKCEDKYSKQTSQFIRVGTAYGICGATFGKIGTSAFFLPDNPQLNYTNVTDILSCTIR